MKLIIGLGNIGSKYIATRHNVGFRVVGRFQISGLGFKKSEKFDAETFRSGDVIFAKPTTLMNRSGVAVAKLVNFYKVDLGDVYVVHDDLDIALGEYKIQRGKGPKVHNGVTSVESALGSTDFWRVRVGVDNRSVEQRANMSGVDYVLGRFSQDEEEKIDKVTGQIVEDLRVRLL